MLEQKRQSARESNMLPLGSSSLPLLLYILRRLNINFSFLKCLAFHYTTAPQHAILWYYTVRKHKCHIPKEQHTKPVSHYNSRAGAAKGKKKHVKLLAGT